jgi:hypothetical protein
MADKPKVTHIEICYDDGSREFADGDAANQVWDWLMSAQTMLCIHGGAYKGPKLTVDPGKPGAPHGA